MPAAIPHYLLFSDASDHSSSQPFPGDRRPGRWKFVLESVDGTTRLEASDEEGDLSRERLELLSVVRGLEALPQPSRVTLITTSRSVDRGLRFGLAEWRDNNWQWEHFGTMLPVKNADLWQRLDRALSIHDVRCRTVRIDAPHAEPDKRCADLPRRARVAWSVEPGLARGCAQRAGHWLRGWLTRSPVRAAQLL
jgi:ribonuclease HI